MLSTRFGFEECSARYDQIEGRYARRYAKKHCSLIYRVIAGLAVLLILATGWR